MGRPRKHENNAAKQKAYRKRLKERRIERTNPTPDTEETSSESYVSPEFTERIMHADAVRNFLES